MRWKELLRPPPGDMWKNAVMCLVLASWTGWATWTGGIGMKNGFLSPMLLVVSLLVALGYWLCQSWARWLMLALCTSALILAGFHAFALREGQVLRVLAMSCCVYGICFTWREKIPSRDEDAE